MEKIQFKAPHTADLAALRALAPTFLVYVLSFVNVAIYWNNHHHLFGACSKIDGRVMWANLHMLFWLSLVPFCTSWVGEHHLEAVPTAFYGVVLLASAVAFIGLQASLVAMKENAALAAMVDTDIKGKLSLALYAIAIVMAFVNQWVSDVLFVAVAMIWFVPDRRIEKRVASG